MRSRKGTFSGTFVYNGLDRIDSNLGYVRSNVVPCCAVCNYMKQELSLSEFLDQVAKIHNVHQRLGDA
jgi:hypothetical protein